MLDAIIPNGTVPVDVVIAVLLLLLGAIFFALYSSEFEKSDRLHRRAIYLKSVRENLDLGIKVREQVVEDLEPRPSFTGRAINALRALNRVMGNVMLFDEKEQHKIRRQLLLAGIRSQDALAIMFTGKILGIVIMIVIVVLTWSFSHPLPVPEAVFWLMSLGAVIMGGAIPEKIVSRLATKRQHAIMMTLPDALDLMIVCTNAGFSLDVTVSRVARDLRSFAPEMADELQILADELRLLQDRREALENLANRTEVNGVRSLVAALVQAAKLGTPINQALRTVAEEIRREHIISLEEWAAKVPTQMTFPIVLLILPAIFLIVGGPAFLNVIRVM